MKKFVDERKRLSNKHEQENAFLLKLVKDEEDALTEENKKVNTIILFILFSCVPSFSFYFTYFLYNKLNKNKKLSVNIGSAHWKARSPKKLFCLTI